MNGIKFPIIILNFKTSLESTGKNSVNLAKIAEIVAKETSANIAICPQAIDVCSIISSVEIPVLAQHIDPHPPGSYTGNNLLEAFIEKGVKGTLVNHSEKRLLLSDIESLVAKTIPKEFFTCVCSNNENTSKAIAALGPHACAMEPPELIGGDISVTTRPELVLQTIESVKQTNPAVKVLVGAGVKTGEDIQKALELGAEGVLLASGFVKAKDPKKVLLEMTEGLLKNR